MPTRDPAQHPVHLVPTPRAGGFTLAEVLVSLALASILISIMGIVFVQAHRSYEITDRRIRAFSDLRFLMEKLETDLQNVQYTNHLDEEVRFRMRRATWTPPGAPDPVRKDELRYVTLQRAGARSTPHLVELALVTEGAEGDPRRTILRQTRTPYRYDGGDLVPDGDPREIVVATGIQEMALRFRRLYEGVPLWDDPDEEARAGVRDTVDGDLFVLEGAGELEPGGRLRESPARAYRDENGHPSDGLPLPMGAPILIDHGLETDLTGIYSLLDPGIADPETLRVEGVPVENRRGVIYSLPKLPDAIEISFSFQVGQELEGLRRVVEITR